MTTIIRATEHNQATQHTAFNFEDMAVRANRYLDGIRAEARKIVAKAQKDATAVKEQARTEGYKAGQQQVDEIIRRQLATVVPALRRAVDDLQHAKQAWLTHWEAAAIHVAAAIAQRILRREITDTPQFAAGQLREALELAAGSAQLRIRLNPNDYAAMAGQADMLTKELVPQAAAEILADESITPGGCRVETSFGSIDQQIELQLARIEEELA